MWACSQTPFLRPTTLVSPALDVNMTILHLLVSTLYIMAAWLLRCRGRCSAVA